MRCAAFTYLTTFNYFTYKLDLIDTLLDMFNILPTKAIYYANPARYVDGE